MTRAAMPAGWWAMALMFLSNNMIGEKEGKFLLKISRRAIDYFLKKQDFLTLNEKDLPSPLLKEKMATFVTLKINDSLRGCIGRLAAAKPLYQDVLENAINSAFFDRRFKPLTIEEFPQIKLEISVLGPAKTLSYRNSEELFQQIEPFRHGIIIEKEFHLATYLPQVWEELPSKEQFLSSLCLKAGLPSDEWKNNTLKIKIYEVEHFQE